MEPKKKKWGRVAVYGERRLTTLALSAQDRALLDLVGDGNMSEGVRRLIEKHRQSMAIIEEKTAA